MDKSTNKVDKGNLVIYSSHSMWGSSKRVYFPQHPIYLFPWIRGMEHILQIKNHITFAFHAHHSLHNQPHFLESFTLWKCLIWIHFQFPCFLCLWRKLFPKYSYLETSPPILEIAIELGMCLHDEYCVSHLFCNLIANI